MLNLRCVLILFAVTSIMPAQTAPDGGALYAGRCGTCHDNGSDVRIPKRADIGGRSPEAVFDAMSSGAMRGQAAGLSAEERRAIARYLTDREFSTSPVPMSGLCSGPAPAFALTPGDWNGWGVDTDNSRYQPRPGLNAADIPRLKLKWAFGFPGARSAFSQPAVAGGRVFVGSMGGTVYSLDAASGCTWWAYNAGAGVRTTITIAKAKNGRYLAWFGDVRAIVHALDVATGEMVWKTKIEEHQAARVTGAPAYYDGRLYVPVASSEEGLARQPKYECCTFRGSLTSLDSETGKVIWKTYAIAEEPKHYRKSKVDTQQWGPAGSGIWASPTVDPKRMLVYAATGDSYTDVDTDSSDAVLAFEMSTGKVVWKAQVLEHDNFVVGCPAAPNCPESNGPDYDFGTSPVLRSIGAGKQVLVAGQKSGIVWGLDPDAKGKVLWKNKIGAGSALGGVEWGPAADEQNAYVAISDRNVRTRASPGLYALNLRTGEKVWGTPAPEVKCAVAQGCLPAQSSAVSVIPGVVFSGAVNGHFRAYSTKTGEILWDFDTVRGYETVNNVEAKGGSIDGPGPAIAGGIVYTNSGYGAFNAMPGNVLLAFSVDGR